MAQETNQSPVPVLCANGCGFYGNPRTSGMCSVCHKEHLSRQNNGLAPMSPMGGGGVSLVSAAEASAIQRLEATLNNAAAAAAAVAAAEVAMAEAAATAEAVAAKVIGETSLSQQMTEMSLICETEPSAKVEIDEPVVTQPSASSTQPTSSDESSSSNPSKPKKNRCFMCRKKVGLIGFDCRCGNIFCGLHRYSDKHNCPYDYKTEAAEKIRKENPVVVADKIQRI